MHTGVEHSGVLEVLETDRAGEEVLGLSFKLSAEGDLGFDEDAGLGLHKFLIQK